MFWQIQAEDNISSVLPCLWIVTPLLSIHEKKSEAGIKVGVLSTALRPIVTALSNKNGDAHPKCGKPAYVFANKSLRPRRHSRANENPVIIQRRPAIFLAPCFRGGDGAHPPASSCWISGPPFAGVTDEGPTQEPQGKTGTVPYFLRPIYAETEKNGHCPYCRLVFLDWWSCGAGAPPWRVTPLKRWNERRTVTPSGVGPWAQT